MFTLFDHTSVTNQTSSNFNQIIAETADVLIFNVLNVNVNLMLQLMHRRQRAPVLLYRSTVLYDYYM
jgi:hypothetical protein